MITLFSQIDKGIIQRKPVVTLINPYTISFDDNRKALKSVNLIKDKFFGGGWGGRTFSYGSKQKR